MTNTILRYVAEEIQDTKVKNTMVSTVNSTITVTIPQCYSLTLPWPGLSPSSKGWVLPRGASTQHAPGAVAGGSQAVTLTPSTCPLFQQPLGTGQTRSPRVWHRCWAIWWLLKERPTPGFCFTPLCIQYRLISSKEPMYKQQLHIFKFPLCTI